MWREEDNPRKQSMRSREKRSTRKPSRFTIEELLCVVGPGKKRRTAVGVSIIKELRKHACEVMRVLGKGHSERVYHRAMITSLNREQIPHRSEVITPIYYLGEVVGFGRCDIIVGDLVVEFKANMWCPSKNSPQIQKYLESLTATERKRFRGVIVNFNQRTGGVEVHQEHMRDWARTKG